MAGKTIALYDKSILERQGSWNNCIVAWSYKLRSWSWTPTLRVLPLFRSNVT